MTKTDEWELYNKPGSEEAGVRLDEAVTRAHRLARETYAKGGSLESAALLAWEEVLRRALTKEQEYGALDSEPAYIACRRLAEAMAAGSDPVFRVLLDEALS